ncbi:MAG: lipid-A-disaccharide synthase [Candidatus Cyclobacteriaceae bacterium M3_2C_046]
MKYYIITGERSGDFHAANLVKALREKDNNPQFRGVGSDFLKEQEVEIFIDSRQLSVMGFVEVLYSFPKVLKFFRQCKADLLQFQPDVLILVDYPGFNLRMAEFAHKQKIRVFYYISPKVWAWNQSRAKKIKAYVDHMFSILPFEPAFYHKYDYKVDYVGSPVADEIRNHQHDTDFLEKNNLPDDKPLIALLPGSRSQELQHILPVMCELANKFPEYHFVVAAVKSQDPEKYDTARKLPNISLVFEQTYDLLAYADGAVVTSGTATLETALFDVPQVVVYKASQISYLIAKQVVKVKYISLVNLIADQEVVKELIQNDLNLGNLSHEFKMIMSDKQKRTYILNQYQKIREALGEKDTAAYTASLIQKYLKK